MVFVSRCIMATYATDGQSQSQTRTPASLSSCSVCVCVCDVQVHYRRSVSPGGHLTKVFGAVAVRGAPTITGVLTVMNSCAVHNTVLARVSDSLYLHHINQDER